MGSGKSVIARKLSEKLDIKCLDLDEIVEKNENLSLDAIFKKKGELYFRKSENKFFTELMNTN